MGIPSYFMHIIREYKSTILQPSINIHVDHLYLDCNSIIYDSISAGPSPADIIQTVCHTIEDYINLIRPSESIMIAFDGVAPIAKMEQQRTRRYKAKFLPLSSSSTVFDTANITPGTTFMDDLATAIRSYFKSLKNCTVSTSQQCGEGEHKLFQHIREHPEKHQNKNTVIYGLDADLIMLSLVHTDKTNLFLFRETPVFISQIDNTLKPNELYCIHIHQLATIICSQLTSSSAAFDIQRIHDYICLGFLLGNDFLPHFPAIQIRTDGIELLLQTYQQHIFPNYLTKGGAIQWRMFSRLFERLATTEQHRFQQRYQMREKYRVPLSSSSSSDTLLHLPCSAWIDEQFIQPFQPGWQERYYWTLFEANVAPIDVCKNYMEGLEWTYHYYTSTCIDWSWKYRYDYPPLLQDLAQHSPFISVQFQSTSAPVHPYVQLCYVLPPQCYSILPVTIINNVKPLLPEVFSLHLLDFTWAYCTYFWEAHIHLPPLSIEALQQKINECI